MKSFNIKDKVLILSILNLFITNHIFSQCVISGQISYGYPLETGIGVTVRETVKKTGVISDTDGSFFYSSSNTNKFTVHFSYEGMEPVEYVFDGSKYSNYKVKVNLYPKDKIFIKHPKSFVVIKEKTKRAIAIPDKTPPTISTTLAEENAEIITISTKFNVYGKVVDNTGIKEIFVNDLKAGFDKDGNFQRIIDLKPGSNTVRIRAIDVNNNNSKYTFLVNRQLPTNSKNKRAALIIGNANYINSRLINTLNDARDFNEKIQSFGFETVELEDLSSKFEIENEVINFCKKVKNYDMVVFYYSGHGLQIDGLNYIVPTRVTLISQESVKNYCVEINAILNMLAGAQCKYKIVILDACRDNPFSKNWTGKSTNNSEKGLAEMSNGANTVIMYATAPGAIASDNLSGRNGLFTQELLKNMELDISLDQIFKLTGKSVSDLSVNCQVPWFSSSLFDDIFLKR